MKIRPLQRMTNDDFTVQGEAPPAWFQPIFDFLNPLISQTSVILQNGLDPVHNSRVDVYTGAVTHNVPFLVTLKVCVGTVMPIFIIGGFAAGETWACQPTITQYVAANQIQVNALFVSQNPNPVQASLYIFGNN